MNGIISGRWVPARTKVETLQAALDGVLATSPWSTRTGEPAEEWIILDHEGFQGDRPCEHEALQSVADLAEFE